MFTLDIFLKGEHYCQNHRHLSEGRTLLPKSLNFPALTNLHLQFFAFSASYIDRAEPFSGCKRLNNLVIKGCTFAYQVLRFPVWLSIIDVLLTVMTWCFLHQIFVLILLREFLFGFSLEAILLLLKKYIFMHLSGHLTQTHLHSFLIGSKGLTNVQSLTVTANTLQVTYSLVFFEALFFYFAVKIFFFFFCPFFLGGENFVKA